MRSSQEEFNVGSHGNLGTNQSQNIRGGMKIPNQGAARLGGSRNNNPL